MSAPLFTPEELMRLKRLRVQQRRQSFGDRMGDWRTARTGAGGLFADHRDYVPGDDLRYVDWNVYGRLGDLVVKRFEQEENLNLLLCVDRSRSMEGAKSHTARRLAAALGYIALAHLEHVRLAWLPSASNATITIHRGRERAQKLLDELGETPDEGETNHTRDLAKILGATRTRGVALVVSDFYDPREAVAGMAHLRTRGFDVAALHVLDQTDVELPKGASVRAVDRETGEIVDVDVTAEMLEALHATWRRRAESIERWCLAREIQYQRVDVRTSFWDSLQEMLRRRVVVGASA